MTSGDAARPLEAGEGLRYLWAQLTSMRTALVLLFALAIVAIPGSLLPQRPTNPVRVSDWIDANPAVGPLLDRIGMFDVYGSPWFAAVYLLLFMSMIGCIVPRIVRFARGVRALPPRAPRHLERLPESRSGASPQSSTAVLDAGEAWLRGHRFRVRREDGALSGERGYLREFGNLLFHVSLVGILVGVAWSSLAGFKGSVIVVEGGAFSNTLSQYDDFTSGGLFDAESLAPFTVFVDSFDVAFERGPVQHGAAREFVVHGRYADASGTPQPTTIEVNHPLSFGGSSVHLIGHGYAPVVTVTGADGRVALSGPVPFLPTDGRFRSVGVIKAPDARPQRLASEAVFVPTQSTQAGVGPVSTFPDADAPELWGNVFTGPPKVETGRPENVYSLDKTGLTQSKRPDGEFVSYRLTPGQSVTLADGATIRFDSWKRWTKLQVSSTPGLPLTFASIALATLGLCLSLFVRPRRLFVRTSEPLADADGANESGALVSVGGLDRADGRTGLDDEVADLTAALGVRVPDRDSEERP